MKYVFFLTFILLTSNVFGQQAYLNADIPLANSFGTFRYIHVVESDDKSVSNGNVIGKIASYPEKFSERFDNEIHLSKIYYKRKDFDSARVVLEKAIIKEPDNAFILDNYARACYYVDRPKSFIIYKKLVTELDSAYGNSKALTIVYKWFQEAYWKLGTLYMDNKEWEKAYFEISRFLGQYKMQKEKKFTYKHLSI